MISRGFTERTKGRVHDIKIQTALEVGLLFRNVQVLGMPRPCEHEEVPNRGKCSGMCAGH